MPNPLAHGYAAVFQDYWNAGWHSPLPLPERRKKSPPGGYTGYSGATPSFADCDTWAQDRPEGNICLRMPDTVIGIDVDNYDGKTGGHTLKHAISLWGDLPHTVRSTSRDDGISGIRLYRVPAGTRLNTVLTFPAEQLGHIEIIQYFHRYAVAWPSIHPDTSATYQWLDHEGFVAEIPRVDDLPQLPPTWIAGLAAPVVEVDTNGTAVNAAQLLQGLPNSVIDDRVVDRLNTAITDLNSNPASRHDTTMRNVLSLLRLGEQGESGVPTALGALGEAFVGAVTAGTGGLRTPEDARTEYTRMITGQRGHQLIAATPSVDLVDLIEQQAAPPQILPEATAADDDGDEESEPAPDLTDLDAGFWGARESLAAIYAMAHARLCSPWSVFGVTLCRALATVPPWITLPPVVGGRGSLNFFTALVGPSGTGKGASASVAGELLPVEVFGAPLGSGEGITHVYVKNVKQDGRLVTEQHRTAAMFRMDEVDSVAALTNRTGATLMPVVRSGFSGEEIGFSYADPTKRLIVPAHSYRMTLYVGVQPARAGSLLSEADGGTPQRFIWMPTTDPRIGTLNVDEEPSALELPDAVDWDHYPKSMDIPLVVRETLRSQHIARQQGKGNALDGHALFTREKVAAGLAVLDGRQYMNAEDWELSGIVMRISDMTRTSIEKTLSQVVEKEARDRGRTAGITRDAADEVVVDRRIGRVCRRIAAGLERKGGSGNWSEIRRNITSKDRDLFEDAVRQSVTAGVIEYDAESSILTLIER